MIPRVTVIILNWNGWLDTVECLESLYQVVYPCFDVVVVDNASGDDSVARIREYCQGDLVVDSPFFTYNSENKPLKITELDEDHIKPHNGEDILSGPSGGTKRVLNQLILIRNHDNHGFAVGNNIAIEFALAELDPDYILLLNNDTVVHPQFLNEIINMTGDRIGIVGPKLLNFDDPHIIDSAGHVISWGRIVDLGHGEVDEGQYDQEVNIIGAMAAAALYKKEMLLDIGLLDSSYITLGEDADLSWRAHNRGWRAVLAPEALVYHKRGRSITKKSVLPGMTLLSTKNTTRYVVKNGNNIHKFLYLFILLKEGLFVMGGSILGKNDVDTHKYFHILLNSYYLIFKSIFSPK